MALNKVKVKDLKKFLLKSGLCRDSDIAGVMADWAFFDFNETRFWFSNRVSNDPKLYNRFTEKNGPATSKIADGHEWKFDGLGIVRIEKQGPGDSIWIVTVIDQQ